MCDMTCSTIWLCKQDLELQVQLAPDCVGAEVQKMVDDLQCGQVCQHKP